MTYYIFTLGCQMNKSDSERIATVLESCGIKSASENEADLIVVNACSVRQSAVDRLYGKLRRWKNKKIFITGCILPHDREKLAKKVDLIFNIQNLTKLNKWLGISSQQSVASSQNYFAIPPQYLSQKEAFVPIMTGCNNFCSYCAVPYTRGREISRSEREIICEVKNLIKRGYKNPPRSARQNLDSCRIKEITLLGQNVNSYKPSFVKLLKKLVKIPGHLKIKFLTSNPWDFPDDLIELVAKEPKISKEIHLPVQSGDNQILKKMNRKYTVAQYLNLVDKLRTTINGLRLSTDIIVGFPSETKKAFENTVKLCKIVKFNKAYIAQYSPRPGTHAFKLKDDVPKEEKKRRWQFLDQLINK